MAEPKKTIDLIGDDAFTDMILAKSVPSGGPTDWYDEDVRTLPEPPAELLERK